MTDLTNLVKNKDNPLKLLPANTRYRNRNGTATGSTMLPANTRYRTRNGTATGSTMLPANTRYRTRNGTTTGSTNQNGTTLVRYDTRYHNRFHKSERYYIGTVRYTVLYRNLTCYRTSKSINQNKYGTTDGTVPHKTI